ncbi:hypothetical protein [Ruminococcus sp.]|uniref:hypothetical protein n=1 Tax=Ruminococcus sp. TaxID=41978 RepID=UPI003995E08D
MKKILLLTIQTVLVWMITAFFSVLLEQGSPFRASGAAGAVSARLEQSDASHGMVSCLKT